MMAKGEVDNDSKRVTADPIVDHGAEPVIQVDADIDATGDTSVFDSVDVSVD